jgi:putative addiction module killer protein
LRDQRARIAILRHLDRIVPGNFGDHVFCRDGVRELRVDVDVGYRVYYAMKDRATVILLCGGDKRTQQADVRRAMKLREDEQ